MPRRAWRRGGVCHSFQPRLGPDVAGGNFVFMGPKRLPGLLPSRAADLDVVQGRSEFRCDLIEFCGGDPKVPMCLLKSEIWDSAMPSSMVVETAILNKAAGG